MSVFHLAILETDTAPESIAGKHGSYGDIIETSLRKGLAQAGNPISDLKVTKWDVIIAQVYPALDSIDAVFVTAGQHDADKDDPWVPKLLEFVQGAYAAKKPILGLCYGHQIISRALGGKVSRNPGGWEVTVKQVNLTPQGSNLFGKKSISLHQMHRDAVVQIPSGLEVIGSTSQCEIQILYRKGRVLTAQGHPEFNSFMCLEMLEERRAAKILDGEILEDATSKVDLEHDGVIFWKKAWDFMLDTTA
ncbi:hypothetical protein G7046_g440 [Stylonectria norvegica]|nr:hypothetical protein G7046_g440 [Stylonectria norvegica]